MTIEGSIWTFAGMTAAVGMGVVFAALFLLSMYMHYFKILTARLEAGSRPVARPAPAKRPSQPPALQPVPAAGKPGAEEARVAAAVAVGLHLEGVAGAPGPEVAAAVAAALALHRGAGERSPEPASRPASGWKLSGRMEAMSSRVRRHEGPRTASPAAAPAGGGARPGNRERRSRSR